MRHRTPFKIYFKAFVALVFFKVFIEDCAACNFQKELESNKQLREVSPEKQQQCKVETKKRTLRQLQLLRKKLLRSFIVILSAIIFGFLCITVLSKTTIKDMLSTNHVFILLSMVSFSWATLARLGWEGQSWKGDTVFEDLDKFIFKSLYWLGTLFAVFAIMPRNTSIETVAESSLPDSKTLYYTYSTIAQTLAGAFGILGAFVLFRLQSINKKCDVFAEKMWTTRLQDFSIAKNKYRMKLWDFQNREDWQSFSENLWPAFLRNQQISTGNDDPLEIPRNQAECERRFGKTEDQLKSKFSESFPECETLTKYIKKKGKFLKDFKTAIIGTAIVIILSLVLLAFVQCLAQNRFLFYFPLLCSVGLSAGCVFLYARLIIKSFEV